MKLIAYNEHGDEIEIKVSASSVGVHIDAGLRDGPRTDLTTDPDTALAFAKAIAAAVAECLKAADEALYI